MNTFVITSDRRTRVKDKIRRIADFVRRQGNFTSVFHAWEDDEEIIAQTLPNADAALAMLCEAVRRRQALFASEVGRAHASPTSARLARLDGQLRTCIRALRKSGVEFIFCWQIAGEVAHLDYATNLSPRFIVEHVIATLDQGGRCRPDRATLASALLTLCNR